MATNNNNNKLDLLVWSDSVLAPTGFGTVSRYVLHELHKSGNYNIDQLAINYRGEFYDRKKYPYQLSPARILNPNDAFGNEMLLRALQDKDYDILWILNDTFVVDNITTQLAKLKKWKQQKKRKVWKTIYYYPVDCTIDPERAKMIEFADASVCMTEFGKQETLRKMPELTKPIDVIYHGTDPKTFHKKENNLRKMFRERYLGITDPNTFLWVNVNRNSRRKDIPRSILAFKYFKEQVPNSLMYVHCVPVENQINLFKACEDLGLSNREDVLFPANLDLIKGGFPVEALNDFYNAGDAFFSTTLGEGWGLTTTEAMCTETPVLLPRNTSAPEILGENEERGYMYECKEQTYVDDSGYRPLGAMKDIVDKMLEVYSDYGTKKQKTKVENATKWVHENTWEKVCMGWLDIFERVSSEAEVGNNLSATTRVELI